MDRTHRRRGTFRQKESETERMNGDGEWERHGDRAAWERLEQSGEGGGQGAGRGVARETLRDSWSWRKREDRQREEGSG